MFHPVGHQPSSVYWRRRILLLAFVVLVVVLLALTISAVSGSDSTPIGAGTSDSVAPSSSVVPSRSTSSSPVSKSSKQTSSPSRRSSSSSAAPVACAPSDLAIQAAVGKSSYQVGDKPMVELQVTNTGSKPCVQDLADRQVVLKVYNGESRVWGSHDCQVQPGTLERTLAVNEPVRVTIQWSGTTSQPGCSGTRQRVGAGTYTLYAQLAGKTGKATRFSIG